MQAPHIVDGLRMTVLRATLRELLMRRNHGACMDPYPQSHKTDLMANSVRFQSWEQKHNLFYAMDQPNGSLSNLSNYQKHFIRTKDVRSIPDLVPTSQNIQGDAVTLGVYRQPARHLVHCQNNLPLLCITMFKDGTDVGEKLILSLPVSMTDITNQSPKPLVLNSHITSKQIPITHFKAHYRQQRTTKS